MQKRRLRTSFQARGVNRGEHRDEDGPDQRREQGAPTSTTDADAADVAHITTTEDGPDGRPQTVPEVTMELWHAEGAEGVAERAGDARATMAMDMTTADGDDTDAATTVAAVNLGDVNITAPVVDLSLIHI